MTVRGVRLGKESRGSARLGGNEHGGRIALQYQLVKYFAVKGRNLRGLTAAEGGERFSDVHPLQKNKSAKGRPPQRCSLTGLCRPPAVVPCMNNNRTLQDSSRETGEPKNENQAWERRLIPCEDAP